MKIKILSWNINSIRARLGHLKRLLKIQGPDIVCLQETKVINESFPLNDMKEIGYNFCYLNGIPSYNGVCILSKRKASNSSIIDWCSKTDGRHIYAKIDGIEIHSIYIPAGGEDPDPKINPKFKHKLDFLKELTDWSNAQRKSKKIILCGDFNIAPNKDDVWSHSNLKNTISHTEIERKILKYLFTSGSWTDAIRKHINPPKNIYTWWSYRSPDYKKNNRGRRLDHIWLSENLENKNINAFVYDETRSWKKPSDHVPISTIINL